MGMNYDHYVIYGYPVKKDEFDMWGDSFLPYIEGHSDVECRLLYGEEESEYAFFGKVYAMADKWNPFDTKEIEGYPQDVLDVQAEYEDAFNRKPNGTPKLYAHSIYR